MTMVSYTASLIEFMLASEEVRCGKMLLPEYTKVSERLMTEAKGIDDSFAIVTKSILRQINTVARPGRG